MWILLVILLSNPHHILIISSSYPHVPSLPGLEQARRTLWCLWRALDAGKVDAQDAPGSLEAPDLVNRWCPWNLQAIFFPSKFDAAPCLFKFFLDNNLIALYMKDGYSREEVVWWRGNCFDRMHLTSCQFLDPIKTLWQLLWLKLQRIFIHGTLDLVLWYYV